MNSVPISQLVNGDPNLNPKGNFYRNDQLILNLNGDLDDFKQVDISSEKYFIFKGHALLNFKIYYEANIFTEDRYIKCWIKCI